MKHNTINLILAVSFFAIFFFTGCPLDISIETEPQNLSNKSIYTINTQADKPILELVNSFDKTEDDINSRIFDTLEIERSLMKHGFENVKASSYKTDINSETLSITTTVSDNTFPFVKKVIKNGKISQTEITLSPEILQDLITKESSIVQKYADLLMAPCFTGEEISADEYKELVASLYGKQIADELTRGSITITQTQNGKSKASIEIPLIEILTLQKEKTYIINK